MKPLITAAGGAVAVAGCVAGLLYLGPAAESPAATAPAAAVPAGGAPAADTLDTARKRTKAYPRDPVGWALLARAEIEQARTTLDASRLEAADHALRRSVALDSTRNYDAVVGRGQLANARHLFTQGREHGLRATRMAPDRPDGYAVLADAEIQLGHYPAARAAAQRLLDLAPGSATYSRAAYDLETNGRPADAGIALERAVDSASTTGERAFAQTRLGDLAWSQGDADRAAKHYRYALDSEPEYPYAVAGTARVLAARGEPDKALDMYERLTERTPLPQFLLETVELRASMSEPGDSGPGGAEAALTAQVRLSRADGGPVDPHLALFAADHGDPAVAVELMRREWKHTRGVITADALAWALHRDGRSSEALEYARRAAATGWDNALFHYHRGAIERALGLPGARRHLREALERNPHFSPYHAVRAKELTRK
ncbi:tetratricopeptide repeat protein [Streptomyces sp. IB2014 016-6]|uniref:tetratricopeptide repeat protein n=1 Tax=Streptomyces sp. IB2014 016-6 TaxID=2517818 RepID=UPI0011C90BCE|nr:tetratricopeptide repeat protein [Streptomyces sp. IB2014 016-6]TXL88076.1 tetratricopeptide repeat protein [Streptomyces sp. IB2014 016-6]